MIFKNAHFQALLQYQIEAMFLILANMMSKRWYFVDLFTFPWWLVRLGFFTSICLFHICMSSSISYNQFFSPLSVWIFNSSSYDLQVFICLLYGIFYNTKTHFFVKALLYICKGVLSHICLDVLNSSKPGDLPRLKEIKSFQVN